MVIIKALAWVLSWPFSWHRGNGQDSTGQE